MILPSFSTTFRFPATGTALTGDRKQDYFPGVLTLEVSVSGLKE
jgi:hypothetical protein